LLDDLADPREAVYYLESALEESKERFLEALRDVAEAHQMTKVAKEAGVARESLYRMLSAAGNPTLSNLLSILGTMGLRLAVEAADKSDELKTSRGKYCVHGTSGISALSRPTGVQYSLIPASQSLGVAAPLQSANGTDAFAFAATQPSAANKYDPADFGFMTQQGSGQLIGTHAR
jgi:probable addiction module antidote protein